MKNQTIGGYGSINAFVQAKLKRFDSMPRTFSSLFALMFSERGNILYERTEGYKLKKTTYGEAHGQILCKAATLRRLLQDVPQGASVGIFMDNSLDWIEAFWAVLACGRNPLLMNLRVDDAQLKQAMDAAAVGAVISDSRIFELPTIQAEALVPAQQPAIPDTFGTQVLVMSSGTSGSIKVCAYTAEEFYHQVHDSFDIICNCRQVKKHYNGQLKLLTFLPFYHVFGLIAVYIWFAFFSRTFVQLNDLSPQTILNTIRRHQVTHIFAVPLFWETVYHQTLRTIDERGEKTAAKFRKGMRLANALNDVPLLGSALRRVAFREVRGNLFGESIQFLITGGSAISRECMEFFNNIGYQLADGYGMSELGITSVELSSSRRRLNACFVGKPLSSVEYRINEHGELLVRAATAASYTIEHGVKTVRDGWFNTHDLAECVRGDYRILGRRDDLIVAPNGENLNPNLIEPQLVVPGVRSVCLTGVREGSAVKPVLLVSVKRHIRADVLSALEQQLKTRLAQCNLTTQLSKVVFLSDDLLQPQDFKLNRARIAADYAAGRFTPVVPEQAAQGAASELQQRVLTLFAAALGKAPEQISIYADFFLDEGGSSLDYFAMVSQLQEEYAVSFPAASGKSLNTVKELSDYLENAMD